jgi:hypothetical protein
MQQKIAEGHQNLALHFEIGRFKCMKNPAFLLNLSSGSVRTVEDELGVPITWLSTRLDGALMSH